MYIKRILKICLALWLLVGGNVFAQNEITVEDIWKKYTFYPSGVPGFNTLPERDFYTVSTKTSIDKHKFVNGEKVSILLSDNDLIEANSFLRIQKINDFCFDKTEKKVLLASQKESIYRRSTKAFYYIVDLNKRTIKPLSDTTKGKQSFATFSPDGNHVAFVRENNLFVVDLEQEKETQITFDGKDRYIINGMADWVYEEELSQSCYFAWSPDNEKIAYLRFDESRVKEFSMTIYGKLYPQEYKYKYPKAGEDNSLVEVHVYNVKNNTNQTIDLGDNSNCYFPRIYWLNNSTDLMVLKLNRHQNKLEFFKCNLTTHAKDLVYTDENSAWLDVTDDYFFLDDNKSMIVTSERNGFNHIYYVVFNGQITPLTNGKWEVANICAVDKAKKLIYYLSNESNVLNRDLYCIDFSGKKKKMLSSGKGWNEVTFSPTCRYYRNVYSDVNTPPIYTLHESSGKLLNTLNDNAAYVEKMKTYHFSPKELFSFITADNIELNGWMIKPPHFDANKKYPVLMYVYGGPGSQEVSNSFSRGFDFAWYQMLAQKGYIIVCTDGRGTATKGDEFKKCIYKQMGKYEAIDQIATANYLKTLPYVDGERIGIWGWSFGGYLSSLSMFTGGNTFKMAMAVAPVTTWRYYDNIYTERFLQTPQENAEGYDQNSPITHAHKLHGQYLLVHGMADDNVHFQNAVDLVTALNKAEKQYEQYFYPNKNHSIYGGNTRYHLYMKLTDFVLKNL